VHESFYIAKLPIKEGKVHQCPPVILLLQFTQIILMTSKSGQIFEIAL